MKKKFEGIPFIGGPKEWPSAKETDFFSLAVFKMLQSARDGDFSVVTHPDYTCYEYPMKMNVLSFSRLTLKIPVTVIGLPVSICREGYYGNLDVLLTDYKKRKGLFLILNMEAPCNSDLVAGGETLSTCFFDNHYLDFSDYLSALRSPYRRRINKALQKGESLEWRKINPTDFSEEMHGLYLQVLRRSDFPLEQLNISFFRQFPGEIYGLFQAEKPVAFVQLFRSEGNVSFLFGGMDYALRDQYDLYYNMLLQIVNIGIQQGVEVIDFGQTAESAKQRIGCYLEPRYLSIFTRNALITQLLKKLVRFFCYESTEPEYNVFSNVDSLMNHKNERNL